MGRKPVRGSLVVLGMARQSDEQFIRSRSGLDSRHGFSARATHCRTQTRTDPRLDTGDARWIMVRGRLVPDQSNGDTGSSGRYRRQTNSRHRGIRHRIDRIAARPIWRDRRSANRQGAGRRRILRTIPGTQTYGGTRQSGQRHVRQRIRSGPIRRT